MKVGGLVSVASNEDIASNCKYTSTKLTRVLSTEVPFVDDNTN